jgi:hypothetical protein
MDEQGCERGFQPSPYASGCTPPAPGEPAAACVEVASLWIGAKPKRASLRQFASLQTLESAIYTQEGSSQRGALIIEAQQPNTGYRLFVGNHHEPDHIWVREHSSVRVLPGFGEAWVVSSDAEGRLEVRVEV